MASKHSYKSHPMPTMNGVKHGTMRAICCAFPADMFVTIQQMALKDGVSFAEQVRTIIEWGLETIHTEDE